MTTDVVKKVWPLDFQWPTVDPFLFCVHHVDRYPRGNSQFGPQASLAGRNIGNDFEGIEGWRMYHGDVVPGFPAHPHRGFETVTIVLDGVVDHADSLGAAGRYGAGDVQWLTAGRGVQHSEMFPLLRADDDNPLELFQIWLNLPAASKMAAPHFKMFWRDTIPRVSVSDGAGRHIDVTIIAGALDGIKGPAPPPDSWAARDENHVSIWLIRLDPEAQWTLPASVAGIHRSLYFYSGSRVRISDREIGVGHGMGLDAESTVTVANGASESRLLLLQGRPIGEPVATYGPFVMNTRAEIQQAFDDYRRTSFGGWPWSRVDQVHDAARGRFARHIDGREDDPSGT